MGDLVIFFQKGGIVMWPLLIFSLVALTFLVERGIALRRAKINVNEFLSKIRKALLVNRDVRAAVKVCEEYKGPVASVVKAALLKYGHPKDEIEKGIESAAVFDRVVWSGVSWCCRRRPTWRPCSASWAPWPA